MKIIGGKHCSDILIKSTVIDKFKKLKNSMENQLHTEQYYLRDLRTVDFPDGSKIKSAT